MLPRLSGRLVPVTCSAFGQPKKARCVDESPLFPHGSSSRAEKDRRLRNCRAPAPDRTTGSTLALEPASVGCAGAALAPDRGHGSGLKAAVGTCQPMQIFYLSNICAYNHKMEFVHVLHAALARALARRRRGCLGCRSCCGHRTASWHPSVHLNVRRSAIEQEIKRRDEINAKLGADLSSSGISSTPPSATRNGSET